MVTVAEAFTLAWKYCQNGNFSQAERVYRQIARANVSPAEAAQANYNLGVVLATQGKIDDAIASYRQALRFNPDSVEAHNNLANLLKQTKQMDAAIASFREAIRLRPDCVEAFINLGTAFTEMGRLDEAVASCQQALRINPNAAEAHNNLGEAYKRLGKLDEALASFHRALRIKPTLAAAHNSLGDALVHLGEFDEALACFNQALAIEPEFGGAHWNRALLWLLRGEFDYGWPAYEWRWTQPQFKRRPFSQPLWDGSPLDGRTILLHAEQGLGDVLQFIRYVPLLMERGAKIIIECHDPLIKLLWAGLPTRPTMSDDLFARGAELPPFAVQAPLGTLPGIFHTSLANIPATTPYLHADARLLDKWRRELERLPGFKVGIAWQGNPEYGYDRQRSIPLEHFAPLAQLPGVQLISLQKGPGTDQIAALAGKFSVLDLGDRLDEASGAFMDTAAIMMNLDLVVSSDTAVPHLAGALGIPVLLALPLIPDWRWLLDRQDSPWYPTMRLFRQTRRGCWNDVFARLATELQSALGNSRKSL